MNETDLNREPIELVELVLPKCANVFGVAPCTAGAMPSYDTSDLASDFTVDGIDGWTEGDTPTVEGGGIRVSSLGGGSGITVEQTYEVDIPGTSATVNYSPALQEGDVIVLLRANDNAKLGGSDPSTSGFTLVLEDLSSGPNYWFEYKVQGPTPDTSQEILNIRTDAASGTAALLFVLRGVNTSNVLDVTTVTTAPGGTGSTVTPDPITTVTDNALVMAVGMLDDATTNTVTAFPAGYTDTAQQTATGGGDDCLIGAGFKLVSTAGTETPGAFTFSKSDGRRSITAAFRPA
jgi:hypothetical protein